MLWSSVGSSRLLSELTAKDVFIVVVQCIRKNLPQFFGDAPVTVHLFFPPSFVIPDTRLPNKQYTVTSMVCSLK